MWLKAPFFSEFQYHILGDSYDSLKCGQKKSRICVFLRSLNCTFDNIQESEGGRAMIFGTLFSAIHTNKIVI